MPALSTVARLLQVLPAGSPAYTHIYRFCSSNSTPQQTPPPPHAGTAATATGATSRTSPPALDIGLDFASMDFEAVARATHAAIARERSITGSALNSQREQELELRLERKSEQVTSQRPSPPSSPSSPAPILRGAETTQHAPAPRRAAGSGFRGRDGEDSGSSQGTTTQSLHDRLTLCVESGNWAKAYKMFSRATDQSCRQVLIPAVGGRTRGMDNDISNAPQSASAFDHHDQEELEAAREAECFTALRKMLAALPPTSAKDRPTAMARRLNVQNLRGITRWTGQHYYLLWKCLLTAGQVQETQRVWSVMQQIGFTDYQMEAKTVNALMSLLRRTASSSDPTTSLVLSAVAPTTVEGREELASQEKEGRRALMTELEQVATRRHLRLAESNRRTAESIRIAEALRHVEDAAGDEQKVCSTGSEHPKESDVHSTRSAEDETGSAPVIAVGDFNGLLRRSTSTTASERVLRMMAKLNLEMEASTFASLIASLHNPQYVLEGHTIEELTAHQPTATDSAADAADASSDVPRDVATKAPYEAYKQERLETALRWFAQCPPTRRSADVYNELLYLLRAKSHWSDFDRILVDLRGNAVVSKESWPETLEPATVEGQKDNAEASVTQPSERVGTSSAPTAEEPQIHDASVYTSSPMILPPNWTTLPNGKTYELLIQRARYVHQWSVMWALYEEMNAARVRGTSRLYEVLLNEARRHPPQKVGGGSGGGADDASQVLLLLYGEMRRNGKDVRSFKNTMNVVNAWSIFTEGG